VVRFQRSAVTNRARVSYKNILYYRHTSITSHVIYSASYNAPCHDVSLRFVWTNVLLSQVAMEASFLSGLSMSNQHTSILFIGVTGGWMFLSLLKDKVCWNRCL
jgi:hypothetical protein